MIRGWLACEWNQRYAGKHAYVSTRGVPYVGTLCGFTANDGVVTHVIVAFSPDKRVEVPVADVQMAPKKERA